MEGSASFFDSLLKGQKEFIDNWMSTATNMQKTFFSMGMPKEGAIGGDVFGMYNSWLKTIGKSYDEMMKLQPSGLGKDTASKLFRSFDSYMKVFELWSPLLRAMQENTINPDAYKDLLDPAKYKELLDKVFGFTSPEAAAEMFGQASKLIETWGSAAQNYVNPWASALQKNLNIFTDIGSSADPNASMNMFHNLYNAFEHTIGKVFKTPQVGKDREKLELILRTMDMYSVYIARSAEFQHKMYLAGEKAMKKVIETIAAKVKAGEDVKSYNEFYKIWSDVNEAQYFELFNTEEFSKVQGMLLESALEFRRQFHKLLELFLADLPIPPLSLY